MRILIVEDDALIAEHLKEILEADGFDAVDLAGSVDEAKNIVGCNEISLLLLDINMESPEAGIELAQYVNDNHNIPFIFITAQSDKQIVGRAVSMNPLAYIVKPFLPVSVLATVNIARNNILADELLIRDGYKEIIIRKSAIIYGKASNNYIELYSLKKKWIIRNTMQNFMQLLPTESFLQTHRSYFVNTKYLESFTTGKIIVGGEEIPVSKGYENDVKTAWNQRI